MSWLRVFVTKMRLLFYNYSYSPLSIAILQYIVYIHILYILLYLNYHQGMGILPLKKRINRNKCSFAAKQRMFWVFAIVKLKLSSSKCTCSFLFTVTGSHQVTSSNGRCDKKCSGRGKGLEVSGGHRVVSFDLAVKKGKVKITNPVVTQVFTTTTPISTTTTTTAGNSPTSTSVPSTDNGCLCVDQGPSRLDELTFNETGQTHAHFPQTGLNLKSCVLPISLQEPLKHLAIDYSG